MQGLLLADRVSKFVGRAMMPGAQELGANFLDQLASFMLGLRRNRLTSVSTSCAAKRQAAGFALIRYGKQERS